MISLHTTIGRRIFDHTDFPFFNFPAGELHMKAEDGMYTGNEYALIQGEIDINDYFKLQLWAQVVKQQGGHPTAIIPYLPGMRADRGTPSSGLFYADMINATDIRVITLDPHSKESEQFYERLTSVFPVNIVSDYLKQEHDYLGVIAPDKGATARAAQYAKEFDVPLYVFEKDRDFESGHINSITAPDDFPTDGIRRMLVVDDICDGGRTFNMLADVVKSKNNYATLDLFVTHGIFSKGISNLSRYEEIYTTDSFPYLRDDYDVPTVIPVVRKLFHI